MTKTGANHTSQRFALTADLPLRALLIASLTALAGSLLVVLWAAFQWSTAVVVAGAVLMVLGVLLAGAAFVSHRLASTVVLLDQSAITFVRWRRRRSLRWADIAEVNRSGPRVRFVTRPGTERGAQLIAPRGINDPVFIALLAAVQQRLDTDRGYQTS